MTHLRAQEYVYNLLALARDRAYEDLSHAQKMGLHENTRAVIKEGIVLVTELMIERDEIILSEEKTTPEESDVVAELHRRANYNREHADELYGETLYYGCTDISHDLEEQGKCSETGETLRWRDRDTLEPVIFTPYGWRLQKDVEKETGETL